LLVIVGLTGGQISSQGFLAKADGSQKTLMGHAVGVDGRIS
jgi:hypothetical protein